MWRSWRAMATPSACSIADLASGVNGIRSSTSFMELPSTSTTAARSFT